ncbi:G1/S-specific cyclin-E1 [Larimichthys crocea]|uniref:Uncharacterized protein n=1 Tax=Larimichthys crocea TaxID=215358 RepID=A0ACD3RH03_LARCR|nr:G1/S-specific cyclin-E1 [Larimichthys crocea]
MNGDRFIRDFSTSSADSSLLCLHPAPEARACTAIGCRDLKLRPPQKTQKRWEYFILHACAVRRGRSYVGASANRSLIWTRNRETEAATNMTRRSGRLQKRSENVLGQKGKVAKQSNRKKVQPLSKLQCEKNQLVLESAAKSRLLVEAASEKGVDRDEAGYEGDSSVQPSPLPHLGWGSSEDVWVKMINREQSYRHSKSFMRKHPRIQPRMRSILLDWLIEVSEAYTLHRQTFYLAQDYFDRFMLTQDDIEKNMLQLIGITCLFIAAKMEEACPPKLSQMAYVTAGTYYEDEILQMELIILKALNWNLCPETAVSWLKLYFQMASMNTNSDLLEPQFPQDAYIQMTRLLGPVHPQHKLSGLPVSSVGRFGSVPFHSTGNC